MQTIAGFEVTAPLPGVWHIRDPLGACATLIVGTRKALLVDTCTGGGDLRAVVQSLTRLPFRVINTHAHPDHTGGNWQFSQVFMDPREIPLARRCAQLRDIRESIAAQFAGLGRPMEETVKASFLSGTTENLLPMTGETLDLGGVHICPVSLPSHSPGMTGFLVPEKRLLLGGDSVCQMACLYFPESASLQAHLNMLCQVSRMDFDRILTSHSQILLDRNDLEAMIQCAQEFDIQKTCRYRDRFFPKLGGRMFLYENQKNKHAVIVVADQNAAAPRPVSGGVITGGNKMSIMQTLYAKAKANPQRVVFPEATEEKILLTARQLQDNGWCTPILVGKPADIKAVAEQFGISLDGIQVVDGYDEAFLDTLIGQYVSTHPLFSAKSMRRRANADPMYTALMMEAVGMADVSFAGLVHTTGDVIIAAQAVIGMKDGVTTVSSSGIFNIPNFNGSEGSLLGFGDSAVCADPSAEDLAGIAIAACETVAALTDWEPRCALLSYSTLGSGAGPMVDKVAEAVKIANEKRPDLAIDGEFQLDAAINPAVAAKKVTRPSRVAGKANIVIWTNIDVGNVGVKLVQQFAGADAYGPFLQGFRKIVCDCSRSSPVSELVGNVVMSCVRAQGNG